MNPRPREVRRDARSPGGCRRLRGLTVLAVLLVATGVGVQASVWTLMPVWYHLAFLGLLVPGCLLGARLKGTGSLTPTAG